MRIKETPLEFVKNHLDMYLMAGTAPAKWKLAIQLAREAAAVGARLIRVDEIGEWIAISSEDDWLVMGRFAKDKVEEMFSSVIPLPEVGQNRNRSEIVLAAIASNVVVMKEEDWIEIVGELDVEGRRVVDGFYKSYLLPRRAIFFRIY